MSKRHEQLAIQTIVVTFFAAVHSISRLAEDSDVRVLLVERARDRALELLDAAEAHIPYLPDSPLDRAIRDARHRIETASVDRQ